MICGRLKQEIQNQRIKHCIVHSVFRSTVNLITPNQRLVSLILAGKQLMPFGIVTDELKTLDLVQGQELLLTEEGLGRSSGCLLLFAQVPSYDCGVRLMALPSNARLKADKLRILQREIGISGNPDGAAGLITDLCGQAHHVFVKPLFDQFMSAYRSGDLTGVAVLSGKLFGYGIGLTPYMDDFFCGLMIAEHYAGLCAPWEAESHSTVIRSVMQNLEQKTNLISSNMIRQAGEGLCTEGILNLMNALLTDKDEDLERYIQQVFQYGSSSGTDICCGILAGLSRGM